MNRRMKSMVFIVIMFVLLLAGTSSIYPAMKARDADIIRVAYMNGYLEALKLGDDDVKKLKKDEALLKQAVEKAANSYVSVINSMNK